MVDLAVLVKVVPPAEAIRFDPARRRLVRSPEGQVVNPFDRRAVQLALELRQAGEIVRVVTMGPPGIEPALRELLALGVDSIELVSDPWLAGSDTLVTARVLTRQLLRDGHDLVLTGAFSTDSETGQVGAEVAALLGVVFVGPVRSAQREQAASALLVSADTETGLSRYRLALPAVLSTSERAAKPRRPTPEELSTVQERSISRATAVDLGFSESEVGEIGSPTVVVSLEEPRPGRRPTVYAEGSVSDRVVRASTQIVEGLEGASDGASGLPPLSEILHDELEVGVLASGSDGRIDPNSLPLLSEVRRSLAPRWPSAIVIGGLPNRADADRLARAGAARVYHLGGEGPIATQAASWALETLLEARRQMGSALVVSSTFGRATAAQLAAHIRAGLTGDAVGIERDADGALSFLKPAFGGSILARIRCRTRPALATVRPGSFSPGESNPPQLLSVETIPFSRGNNALDLIDEVREVDESWGDLNQAPIAVILGMGVGGPTGIAEIRGSLSGGSVALGATRRVVDAGWVPRQLQVGLTGRSISPPVAVLVGVSGSGNHLVGVRRARRVLAVNSNVDAPVFRACDVGIVGDWREVLSPLLAAIRRGLPPVAHSSRG